MSLPDPDTLTAAESLVIAGELRDRDDLSIQIDARAGFFLVSMLQLALRHAEADDWAKDIVCASVRAFAHQIQAKIGPEGSLTVRTLEKGWDRGLDVPRAAENPRPDLVKAVQALLSLAHCMATGPGWTTELFQEATEFAADALRAAGAHVPPLMSIADVQQLRKEGLTA